MQLDLIAYKTASGFWAFDHSFQDTVAEALLNGTELVIDAYYTQFHGRAPRTGDRLPLRLDTEPLDPCTTTLEQIAADHHGTTYRDLGTGMTVWLCPWLERYFEERPARLHVLVV